MSSNPNNSGENVLLPVSDIVDWLTNEYKKVSPQEDLDPLNAFDETDILACINRAFEAGKTIGAQQVVEDAVSALTQKISPNTQD